MKEEGEGQVEVSFPKRRLIKTIEPASVAFGHRKKRLHGRLSYGSLQTAETMFVWLFPPIGCGLQETSRAFDLTKVVTQGIELV